ncbi:formin BNR1 LALA0_S01e18756g [Lachancea lanzarotensis]|uniref:LALA0S01e18756g1_1 n=1 Tax=Lachancea lanzarotensis TaxID=1245769 RepID=A0A0C7MYX5_9SACH|nr:uncharacterized protein LALA0_S01e18756g [Lachancea lanzarotensis]CEP60778.1 LALA0S01e18756g1_1 [Lachancea lanzarotensis]
MDGENVDLWKKPHKYDTRSISLDDAINRTDALRDHGVICADNTAALGLSLVGVGLTERSKRSGPGPYVSKARNFSTNDVGKASIKRPNSYRGIGESDHGGQASTNHSKLLPSKEVVDESFNQLLKSRSFFWGTARSGLLSLSHERKWQLVCKERRLQEESGTEKKSKSTGDDMLIDALKSKAYPRKLVADNLYEVERLLRRTDICEWFLENEGTQQLVEAGDSLRLDDIYVYLRCFKTLTNHKSGRLAVAGNERFIEFLCSTLVQENVHLRVNLLSAELLLLLTFVEAHDCCNNVSKHLESRYSQWFTFLESLLDGSTSADEQTTLLLPALKPQQILQNYCLTSAFLINSVLQVAPSNGEKLRLIKAFQELRLHRVFHLMTKLEYQDLTNEIDKYKSNEERIISEANPALPDLLDISYGQHLNSIVEQSRNNPLEHSVHQVFESLSQTIMSRTMSDSLKALKLFCSVLNYLKDYTYGEDNMNIDSVINLSLNQLVDNLQSDEIAQRALDELTSVQKNLESLELENDALRQEKNVSKASIMVELQRTKDELATKLKHIESLREELELSNRQRIQDKTLFDRSLANKRSVPPSRAATLSAFDHIKLKSKKDNIPKLTRNCSLSKSSRFTSLSDLVKTFDSDRELSLSKRGTTAANSDAPFNNSDEETHINFERPSQNMVNMDKKKNGEVATDDVVGRKGFGLTKLAMDRRTGSGFLSATPPIIGPAPDHQGDITRKPAQSVFDRREINRGEMKNSLNEGHTRINETASENAQFLPPRQIIDASFKQTVPPPPPPPLPQTLLGLKPSDIQGSLTGAVVPASLSTKTVPGPPPPPPPPPPPLPSFPNRGADSLPILPSNDKSKESQATNSPPAAPPAPSSLSLLMSSRPTENSKPQVQLKQIHWEKIENVTDTIWNQEDGRQDVAFHLKNTGIFDEISELFEVKKANAMKARTVSSSAKGKISILARDLAQQFGINLHMFSNLSVEDFVLKVLHCDREVINNQSVLEFFAREDLSNIPHSTAIKFEPYATNYEIKKNPTLDSGKLERADRIFLELCFNLKSYWNSRSACLLTLAVYEKDYFDIMYKLQRVDDAVNALKSSKKLQEALMVIVEIGNHMNRKQAPGIKISSLQKLAFVKSSADSHTSLLHVVERVLREKCRDAYGFVTDLTKVTDLGNLVVGQIEQDCQEYLKRITSMKQSLEKGRLSDPKVLHPEDRLLVKVGSKVETATRKSNLLRNQCALTMRGLENLMKLYGEDGRNADSKNEFLHHFARFVQQFKKAAKDNLEKEEMERVYRQRTEFLQNKNASAGGTSEEGPLSSVEQEQDDTVDVLIKRLRGLSNKEERLSSTSKRKSDDRQLWVRTKDVLSSIQKI